MIATVPVLDLMAKKAPPPPPSTPDDLPSSETARIATDLMELMREICFGTRDTRGKRPKITQLLDGYLRPVVLREYKEFKKRQSAEAKAD